MHMTRLAATVALASVVISGCANSINYHHSERTSIALEAKPNDPTQPIQGNVGLKARTILVAPGVKGGFGFGSISGSEKGESTSAISDFYLRRKPASDDDVNSVFGTTIVRGAFITGDAAKAVAGKESGGSSTGDLANAVAVPRE